MKENNTVQSNNAFVKSEQAKMKKHMGTKPTMPAQMKKFDAFMSNDGQKAEAAGRKLCAGLEDAFPLK